MKSAAIGANGARALLVWSVCALSLACSSSDDTSPQPMMNASGGGGIGGSGGMDPSGAGGAAGTSIGGASGAMSTAGGSGGLGGTAAGAGGNASVGDLEVKPDVSTEKVASCEGVPDMTLCDVVTDPDRWYDVCVRGVCVSPGCGDMECNASGPHFTMPPFNGHDAFEVRTGPEPVSIDLITGLHWTSCGAGLAGDGCTEGTVLEVMSTLDAATYCDELQWADHDDWYLPDIFELVSLIDADAIDDMNGMLSPRAFPNQSAIYGFYWSTTRVVGRDYLFSTGKNQGSYDSIISPDSFSRGSVMCVRRGFSEPMPEVDRFVRDLSELYVMDQTTGLTMQRCSSEAGASSCIETNGEHTAGQGAAHCEAMVWAGHDDWRLPNYKEALSFFVPLTPVTGGRPGLDDDDFAVVGPYILLSAGLLAVEDGNRVGSNPDKAYPVLCVRGPD